MDTKHKITIPKPCHENWDKMTPNYNGRFCGSCSKTVVDFTNMLPDEIQMYFQQHDNVCGRFKNSQLNSLTIQIPNRVLYSQTQYHKIFLLALFMAMGTTLFSCSDKNGNKQKIEKIEVINDTTPKTDKIMVGDVKYNPNDPSQKVPPPPPPPNVNHVKFVKPEIIQCGEVDKNKTTKHTTGEVVPILTVTDSTKKD